MKVKIKFNNDYLTCHPGGEDWVIKAGTVLEVTPREHPIFGPCYWYDDKLFWEKRDLPVEEIPNSMDFIVT